MPKSKASITKLSRDYGDDDKSDGSIEDIASLYSEMGVSVPHSKTSFKNEDSSNLEEKLVKKETTRVNLSKLVVYGVILAAAIVVGICTYVYMEKEEAVWYQDEFEEFAEELIETGATNYHKIDLAIGGLSDAMTSYATDTTKTLPFLSLPNFGVRASKVQALAGTEMVAFVPFVGAQELEAWQAFAVQEQGWILKDLQLQEEAQRESDEEDALLDTPGLIHGQVYDAPHTPMTNKTDQRYALPVWQVFPTPTHASQSPVMMDLHSVDWIEDTVAKVVEHRAIQFSTVQDVSFLTSYIPKHAGKEGSSDDSDSMEAEGEDSDSEDDRRLQDSDDHDSTYHGDTAPKSLVVEPVFASFHHDAAVVGVVIGVLPWIQQFTGLLEGDEAKGMVIDLENTCDPTVYSFVIREHGTEYLGANVSSHSKDNYVSSVERGEYHWNGAETSDSSSDDRRRLSSSDDSEDHHHEHTHQGCLFFTSISMSDEFVETWQRDTSWRYTVFVVTIFVFTGLAFLIYDFLVKVRQKKIMRSAKQTNEIVESLFPKNVRDQLMDRGTMSARRSSSMCSSKQRFRNFLLEDSSSGKNSYTTDKPIADYFSNTTIMFADMVGFTSWSSAREPSAVFKLLETLYGSFDRVAERRGVFKVETVGDCYVAVCGLPTPNKNHAVVMARFARDVQRRMNDLVQQLEKDLGPGTGALCMRIGLHSGPVTAGVLRGKNARFQLFGDSVNTTARIETTGAPNRIHCSSECADLIKAAGKEDWLEPRQDKVTAKGLGELSTYFINIRGGDLGSTTTSVTEASSIGESERGVFNSKTLRLVEWSTETLSRLLQRVVQSRQMSNKSLYHQEDKEKQAQAVRDLEQSYLRSGPRYLSEVQDAEIILPDHNDLTVDRDDVDMEAMDSQVVAQIQQYVLALSSLYHDNPFHNWDHACTVAHSALRLLSRLAPDGYDEEDDRSEELDNPSNLHWHLDDPLTQFAFVLSALIHDVDHSGAPNSQLVQENSPLAVVYDQSIAEQNSVAVGWNLLMEDRFRELRRAIYQTPEELRRFRQLVLVCVLSTDIVDQSLTQQRSARWNEVFGGDAQPTATVQPLPAVVSSDPERLIKSKTSILMEHLIQASDVAHTLQHWLIYRKWNECLFMEIHKAYMEGRSSKDPAEFWYEGEMGFFDHYIIPLASKLYTCGVLKVSNDEIVSYARQNRTEWEIKGRDIVAQMKAKAMKAQSNLRARQESRLSSNPLAMPDDYKSTNFGESWTNEDLLETADVSV